MIILQSVNPKVVYTSLDALNIYQNAETCFNDPFSLSVTIFSANGRITVSFISKYLLSCDSNTDNPWLLLIMRWGPS